MDNKNSQTVKFIYNKTANYRTYSVDGVYGGISPKGNLFIELFTEKLPTAETITYQLLDNGNIGKEIEKKQDVGIVREIEGGLYLDLKTATVIADWLNNKVNEFKEIEKLVKEGKQNV
jgi:hypothetical protein